MNNIVGPYQQAPRNPQLNLWWQNPQVKLRVAIFVVACIVLYILRSNFWASSLEADQRAAVLQVLRQNKEYEEQFKSLSDEKTVSEISRGLALYCRQIEALDLSSCPVDFCLAFRQYGRACQDLNEVLLQFPDGFVDALLKGTSNTLLKGELDGGAFRLQAEFHQASEKTKTTWEEVERCGAKYGAAL